MGTETIDFGRYAEAVATKLLGEPNKALSKGKVRRYGSHGSVAFDTAKGVFFDHELSTGGGVLWLLEREKGLKGGDALDWLRREVGADIPQANGSAGPARSKTNGQHAPKQASAPREVQPAQAGETGRREEVQSWDYTDPQGSLVYQVVRFQWRLSDGSWRVGKDGKIAKTYQQRRPAPEGGGWLWNLDGIGHTLLYRSVELREAIAAGETIFVSEGEKNADSLWAEELPATTNSGGAQKWTNAHAEQLAGADVVVLVDNDDVGRKHGQVVARSLRPFAKRVRLVDLAQWTELPPKGDVSDWLGRGGSADKLLDIADETQTWAPAPHESQFGAVWFHEIGARKPQRDWLAKGLLLARSFAIGYGPPGCGKSFLITDLTLTAAHAALTPTVDHRWFGYKIRPFGTVYVAAEGQEDFEVRLHAWRMERGLTPEIFLPFVLLPTPIDLRSSDADTNRLCDEIKALDEVMQDRCGIRCEQVVIDTVSRALAGGNENASDDMASFVINCGNIRSRLNLGVTGIHHGGKEGGRGPRGSEVLHGATDAEYEVAGATAETANSFTIRKLKAGPSGSVHRFKLRSVRVSVDEDGDPVTSCVVEPTKNVQHQADGSRSDDEGLFEINGASFRVSFGCLLAALAEHGGSAPAGVRAPKGAHVVHKTHWIDEAMRRVGAGGHQDPKQRRNSVLKTIGRHIEKFQLPGVGLIGVDDPFVWWTGKAVKGFRSTYPGEAGSTAPTKKQADKPSEPAADDPDLGF